MTTFTWIIAAILFVVFCLFIFGLFTRFSLIADITACLFSPIACTVFIYFMKDYSQIYMNIFSMTILAVSIFTIGSFVIIPAKNYKALFLGGAIFNIGNIICFLRIFMPTFYLFHVDNIYYKIFLGTTIFLYLILCICSGLNSLHVYLRIMLEFAALSVLTFCAIITFINDKRLYAELILIGAGIMQASYFYCTVINCKERKVNRIIDKILQTFLPAAAEVLLTAGSFFMIA